MGDIGTHAQINEFVSGQMQRVIPTGTIPQEAYAYMELGNFLTDVSQFRDPPAFHRAREAARTAASRQSAFAGWVGRDEWANGMFGQATGNRHGWLPEFMRQTILGVTHQIFDPDGISGLAVVAAAAGMPTGPISPHPIDAAEVDRVFTAHFTQYWPHEHLDFPPVPDLSRHWETPGFQIGTRNILSYLERYFQFISEELSKLEFEWAGAIADGSISLARHRDCLIRLGHLLHAVEDYYFHSNFVEIRQWQFAKERNRAVDTSTPEGHDEVVMIALAGTEPNPNSVHLRRVFHRRLRYPIYPTGDSLSRSASRNATNFVYTGGFGQTDVWHTLGGALEAMESYLVQAEQTASSLPSGTPGVESAASFRETDLILMRLLFNEQARQDMVDGDLSSAHMDTHATQVTSGQYGTTIARLRAENKLSVRAAECLQAAFAYDRAREQQFRYFPGPGGVLISMLDMMQRERGISARQVARLDSHTTSITDRASFNEASGESVGTHSLMSKDSGDKQPLRADAFALAKHASAGVAVALATRLQSGRPITEGVDWDSVVRFYVRFPRYRSAHWEEELISAIRRNGNSFSQPDVGSVIDQPPFRLLGPTFEAAKLAARRSGTTMAELEARYRSFETNP